eukprot:CAMPEP_0113578584 /NCGR_PEP_ID=MMETSP0015_2-20120614/29573_1 /TAXON_ID=2838 /ORGANISM="Odontella" /LENGTH=271 /DNA_ID=CAMNT_0000482427 /DNA_START=141 /DNA_END=953 /DNA_ORIENTATION=+ /assembly_acc=CAM_ASM_000160
MGPFAVAVLFFLLIVSSWAAVTEDIGLRTIEMPGVVLYKTNGPLKKGQVEEAFPGHISFHFIQKAYGIDVLETQGGKRMIENSRECAVEVDSIRFGANLLGRAKSMFVERGYEHELQSFLETGVSNPDAGLRRMHWAGIEILPNQSLALHSHPNVEFAYIVEGVMHEWRLTDPDVEKKRSYEPEIVEINGKIQSKYIGPNLTMVDASETFEHNLYHEGEMFINTIGDVHQSFTKDEGVKLFVMWGDGNADVPKNQHPQNAGFLNQQSAQAW